MKKNENYCKDLYGKYMDLEAKVKPMATNKKISWGKMKIRCFKWKNEKKFKELEKELLKNCKDYLKTEDKIEIKKDIER